MIMRASPLDAIFILQTISMKYISYLCLFLFFSTSVLAQDTAAFSQQEIIYGHKEGVALSLLMVKPAKANGKGIISMVSGNWISNFDRISLYANMARPFIDGGYTVFLVVHSSGPRYTITDAVADVKRAVQFIRFNAASYGIDPAYIGITGTSSGGHLSLMAGTSDDAINPDAKDPVSRVSSKVQAVAVFAPPTDFLNFGKLNFNPVAQKQLLQMLGVSAAFEFKALDSVRRLYVPVTDTAKIMAIAKAMSPAQQVTPDDAPTYIMHGDADLIVPLQQSQEIVKKFQEVKVPVVLKVKPGAGHGWKEMVADEKEFVAWFDKYLNVKGR